MKLAEGTTQKSRAGRSYEEQYHWLRQLTDTRSELERRFLDCLFQLNGRLPDYAQRNLADYPCCPDFYYEARAVCVFCDGSVHDTPEQGQEDAQIRGDIEDLGYRVVVIRYDQDLGDQIRRHADVFGVNGDS